MLMESMEKQPEKGDICLVKYSGYDSTGLRGLPVKEGVGEYIETRFWGGGRYQRVFLFAWGKESIYDDHDCFELTVLRCSEHPHKKARIRGGLVICSKWRCGKELVVAPPEPVLHPPMMDSDD